MRNRHEVEERHDPDPHAAARMRQVVTLYGDRSTDAEALRRVLTEAVRELRDAGARPETVLVALKAILDEANIRQRPIGQGDTLHDVAVHWCIEAYFD